MIPLLCHDIKWVCKLLRITNIFVANSTSNMSIAINIIGVIIIKSIAVSFVPFIWKHFANKTLKRNADKSPFRKSKCGISMPKQVNLRQILLYCLHLNGSNNSNNNNNNKCNKKCYLLLHQHNTKCRKNKKNEHKRKQKKKYLKGYQRLLVVTTTFKTQ